MTRLQILFFEFLKANKIQVSGYGRLIQSEGRVKGTIDKVGENYIMIYEDGEDELFCLVTDICTISVDDEDCKKFYYWLKAMEDLQQKGIVL